MSIAAYALVVVVTYRIAPVYIGKAVLVVFVLCCMLEISLVFSLNRSILRKHLRYLRKPWQQWFLLLLVYMASWPMVMSPFLKAGVEYLDNMFWWALIALCILPFSHWMWFVTWRMKKTSVWKLRVVPLFAALTVSGLPVVYLDSTLNAFGLGMMPNVDVVLTARGCDIAHAAWPERACAPDHRGAAEAYRLENVEVLTRIGGHYLVAAPGALDDEALPRFPIPADEVLSWRRHPPAKPAAAEKK